MRGCGGGAAGGQARHRQRSGLVADVRNLSPRRRDHRRRNKSGTVPQAVRSHRGPDAGDFFPGPGTGLHRAGGRGCAGGGPLPASTRRPIRALSSSMSAPAGPSACWADTKAGADALAVAVANALGAEAVITTSSEAAKDLIVGVGCRRGTPAEAIVAAVRNALAAAGCPLERVRLLATVDLKADEAGLQEAARRLQVPLRWIAAEEIRATTSRLRAFAPGARESRSARRCRTGSLAGGKEDPINTPQDHSRRRDRGDRPGKLYAVGIGPGGRQHRTYRAVEAIGQSRGDRRLQPLPGADRRPDGRQGDHLLRHDAGDRALPDRPGRAPPAGETVALGFLRRRRHLRHGRAGDRAGPGRSDGRAHRGHSRRDGGLRRGGGPGRAADAGFRRRQPQRSAGALGGHSHAASRPSPPPTW